MRVLVSRASLLLCCSHEVTRTWLQWLKEQGANVAVSRQRHLNDTSSMETYLDFRALFCFYVGVPGRPLGGIFSLCGTVSVVMWTRKRHP